MLDLISSTGHRKKILRTPVRNDRNDKRTKILPLHSAHRSHHLNLMLPNRTVRPSLGTALNHDSLK